VTSINISELTSSQERAKLFRKRIISALPPIALIVILLVFWWLKLVGITMAGEAFCGNPEHVHGESCREAVLVCPLDHEHLENCYEDKMICEIKEHVHIATCYSNINADLETAIDWEGSMKDIRLGCIISENIVLVAESQMGYRESTLNFMIGDDGERHGYTRYGQWYGNPYGEWSTMFTSFCLRYAGAKDLPISSGAEALRILWEKEHIYLDANFYKPVSGDIVFLDTDKNGSVNATAVITSVDADGFEAIQGNCDHMVDKVYYTYSSELIAGYGTVSRLSVLTVVDSIIQNGAGTEAEIVKPTIATTVNYSSSLLNSSTAFLMYTQGTDGKYYAIDGYGHAVEIFIDANGNITTNITQTDALLWTFTYCGTENNSPTYYIQNIYSTRYLHPYYDNASSHGSVLTGRWESAVINNGSGAWIKGARQTNGYAMLVNNYEFTDSPVGSASTLYFAKAPERCVLWFDGTSGGLRSLQGSPDTAYFVNSGDVIRLPLEWQSPTKYEYKLNGWYDVVNRKYYAPGAEVTVTGNTVFYADWIAASYDIGQFNDKTVNTESTNSFITTRVFDYGALFNALSSNVSVNVTSSGHSETWSLVQSGSLNTGDPTLNYIFIDYDAGGDISYPNNRGNGNNGQDNATPGLYNERLAELLFGVDNSFDPETGNGVLGKHYLGLGDYLFRFEADPDGRHYGYYYYDSKYNAASYNQSEGRFYVYDYLERTADTARDGDYSDFLPLNSPYKNTNGHNIPTYTYGGEYGEYSDGTIHYQYDSKHSGGNDAAGNVITNYWYGMRSDLKFFIPDEIGSGGNKDIFGNDMHFHFSGDDDVWILVDGVLVLDIGGIHGVSDGDVNFSTGVITREGQVIGDLSDFNIEPGEHVLTIYYLERGSSRSNCEIYFNLAPRYDFKIRKEDVLTGDVLNGAEFSVFMDKACTIPAELWNSKSSYENGDPAKNVFVVENGMANMWGMTSGREYYIKETKPPDREGYSLSEGIICLTLDHRGYASYVVEILEGENGAVSPGFTVHGLKVDIEKQEAYVVVTNAEDWVKEVTSVEVSKKWNDSRDHSDDLPVFYLTVKDPDGTVRRIRQIKLGKDNGWKYTWTNLPKYYVDGENNIVDAIEYSVEEAFYPGYTANINKVDKTASGDKEWAEAYQFENGEVYVLKTAYGCLSTASETSPELIWVNEDTAKSSPAALWRATVNSDGSVVFTNLAGRTLHLSYRGDVTTSIFTTVTDTSHVNMRYKQVSGQGIRIYHEYNESWNNSSYYIGSVVLDYNGIYSVHESSGVIFTPMVEKQSEIVISDGSFIYEVTNTEIPNDNLTSVTVNKLWDMGVVTSELYKTYQVEVKLYADGYDTGRSGILNIQNGWSLTFEGLPLKNSAGDRITYTVKEEWNEDGWEIIYGGMTYSDGKYTETITNRNKAGYGFELPATVGYGSLPWTLCGASLMLLSIFGGCIMRRKRERRAG